MAQYAYENASLGSGRVCTFDPTEADSDIFLPGVEGEMMSTLQIETSAARPNAGGGQMLSGSVYEFAGESLLTVPHPHGVGAVGQLLYPTLQEYATEKVVGLVPNGAKVQDVWLCILPDITDDLAGEPAYSHHFYRVIPAQKQHLAKYGNPGNRGSQPDAAQFVTTFKSDEPIEPLRKGFFACKAADIEAMKTALGWTFVPETPAAV